MSHAAGSDTMERGFSLDQAVAEAERCLLCHDAPCSKGCPAETDPGRFIRKLRLRNVVGAIRTIKANNPLGGVCGVLCPTARLCEKECSATAIDRPIRIGKLQRFLVEQQFERGVPAEQPVAPNGAKVAVVGAGPAGLACAAELARRGFAVTVFEARQELGGALRYGVPSHRLDAAFLDRELATLATLGIEFRVNSPITGEGGAESLLQQGFGAVFLGAGLWEAVRLRPGRAAPAGALTSLEFLAAAQDGGAADLRSAVQGRRVAVIGGGSVAVDCAETAVRLGAKEVYLVYRRSFLQMPAESDERVASLEAGVHYLLLQQAVDFATDTEGRLTGLQLVRTELGEPDASGRRRPLPLAGSEWTLPVEIVVEALGNRSATESPSWYPNVTVDAGRRVVADPETGRTSVPGVFAGGDLVRGPALVVQAVADGKRAAAAIAEFLSEGAAR